MFHRRANINLFSTVKSISCEVLNSVQRDLMCNLFKSSEGNIKLREIIMTKEIDCNK